MKEVLNTKKITIEEVKKTGGKLKGMMFCFIAMILVISKRNKNPKSRFKKNLKYNGLKKDFEDVEMKLPLYKILNPDFILLFVDFKI